MQPEQVTLGMGSNATCMCVLDIQVCPGPHYQPTVAKDGAVLALRPSEKKASQQQRQQHLCSVSCRHVHCSFYIKHIYMTMFENVVHAVYIH